MKASPADAAQETGHSMGLVALLDAVRGREAFLTAESANTCLLDLVCRSITETQLWNVDPWPVFPFDLAESGNLVRRISRSITGAAAGSAFDASADANRQALLLPEQSRRVVDELQRSLEEIAAGIAGSAFGSKYGVERILMVGSTSRCTYTNLPVDLDLAVLTRCDRADIAAADAQAVSDDIAGRLAQSAEFAAYSKLFHKGDPDVAISIEFGGIAVRGRQSLVARYHLVTRLAGTLEKSLFLDITYGRMPHTLGYEIWIRRYFNSLAPEWSERVRAEIRLAKSVLKQIKTLYGSAQRGLRAHAVEQMVIQSFNYRASGLPIGTFDNAMQLLLEEIGDLEDPDLRRAYEDYKGRFPLWHVGWWETEVGLDRHAGNFNFWDFLGDGDPDAAAERWKTLIQLARRYDEYRSSGSPWTVEDLTRRVLAAD
ncbi:MAG: hypothetical protein ABL907_01580 [Hyphomicrobium sp.]